MFSQNILIPNEFYFSTKHTVPHRSVFAMGPTEWFAI